MKIVKNVAVLTLLTVLTGIGKPAQAQASVASLPDGNYRYCSERPDPSIGWETGYCFRFRKSGARITGDFYIPHTEHSVCISGKVNSNTVTGHGLEYVFGRSGLFLYPYEGDVLVTRDRNVFRRSGALSPDQGDNSSAPSPLMVASGHVVKSGYMSDAPETLEAWIQWGSALINLNGFHRYNAGSELPPNGCKIS